MNKHQTFVDETGKHYTFVGEYKVVQEGKRFSGIYKDGVLLTSRTSWKAAIKEAKLLNQAYNDGRESMREDRYI